MIKLLTSQTIIIMLLSYVTWVQRDIISKSYDNALKNAVALDYCSTFYPGSVNGFISDFAKNGIPLTLDDFMGGADKLDAALNMYIIKKEIDTNKKRGVVCQEEHSITFDGIKGIYWHDIGISGWKFKPYALVKKIGSLTQEDIRYDH